LHDDLPEVGVVRADPWLRKGVYGAHRRRSRITKAFAPLETSRQIFLTANEPTFTLKTIMQPGRIQNRDKEQIGAICRGALFCGYSSGISSASTRPMTHLPACLERLAGNDLVDWRGG
jgi:hypothetical protein